MDFGISAQLMKKVKEDSCLRYEGKQAEQHLLAVSFPFCIESDSKMLRVTHGDILLSPEYPHITSL